MKKSNFIYLFVLLAGMVCLDACKKKADPAPIPRKDLLAGTSSKKWKLTSATGGGVDFLADEAACSRDNLYVFYTDKKMVVEEGAVSCSPPTTVQGAWKLSTDEKTLTISGGSDWDGDYTIVEMSSTTLKTTFATKITVIFTAQ